ncbi:MAG: hypothetical protein ACNS62_22255 [Candidatus Cyclobacteriaceae bacterium M3_2C_046]
MSLLVSAQDNLDKVVLKDGAFIEGKVKEIAETFILIEYLEQQQVQEYQVEKGKIARIIYANGYEETFRVKDKNGKEQLEQPKIETDQAKQEVSDREKPEEKLRSEWKTKEVILPDYSIFKPSFTFLLGAGYAPIIGDNVFTNPMET